MTEPKARVHSSHRYTDRSSNRGATRWLWIALVIAAAAYGGWYVREHWAQEDRAKLQDSSSSQMAPEPAQAVPLEPLKPLEQMPAVERSPSDGGLSALSLPHAEIDGVSTGVDPAALDQMVIQWLGQQALQWVVTPGIAHHVVATVDNLPRSHVAPRLWPLNPVGGKMHVETQGDRLRIAPGNAERYASTVNFITHLDPVQVAQWYQLAYPILQQTYEQLGYPSQQFHARLLNVIDHLLQTPAVSAPLELHEVQINNQGTAVPQQPWLRYEFATPALQSLSAGQKILIRMGGAHQQRLMDYLKALRTHIAY